MIAALTQPHRDFLSKDRTVSAPTANERQQRLTGALHPIFAAALAPFVPANVYRGWTICFDNPPIPTRDFDWSATSPDYDASYEGPEDGWVNSGTVLHARTRDALIEAIDDWFEENRGSDLDEREAI